MRAERGERISSALLLLWVAHAARASNVLGLQAEGCQVQQNLAKVQCYGLEADELAATASECEANCCSDEKCEAWQFRDGQGCWRGIPYSCEANGGDFARGSVGARLRNNMPDRALWTGSARIYNQLVAPEPYAQGPDEMFFQTQDLELFRVRRYGSALEELEIANFCWKDERQPGNCCRDVVNSAYCFEDRAMHNACCKHIYGQGGEPWYQHPHLLKKSAVSFFASLFPPFQVDEAAYEAIRMRWRVGRFEADRVCAGGWDSLISLPEAGKAHDSNFDENRTRRGDVVEAVYDLVGLLADCPRSPLSSRTFVNIGAGPCAWPDPLHTLLTTERGRGFRGLAIEQNQTQLNKCIGNIGTQHNVQVHSVNAGILLPTAAEMVASKLQEHRVVGVAADDGHMDLGVLVVDIDAWDCSVVEELLHNKVRPLVIVVEMAFHIPPPFRFSMQYDTLTAEEKLDKYDVDWLMPASGCSLSYALHAFRPHGYFLLRLTGTDAIFVHEAATSCLEGALGVRFPIDEFSCYRRSQLWMQAPAINVRDWFFAKHPSLAFGKIWSNLTQMNAEGGHPHQPFTLDY
mmetsp:Transcript_45795/g.83954  ORF Transcript_45795/g.83954 Transcript_45795/m.83954 type:complete len:574 (-) Transcript_45795:98-1819(-)